MSKIKLGWMTAIIGFIACMVCLIPIFGGVIFAEGIAAQSLAGEALIFVGLAIVAIGVVLTIWVLKRQKKSKASCDPSQENPHCSVPPSQAN